MAGQCLANVYINNPESLPIAGANLDGSSKIGIYKTSPIKIGTTVIEGTSDMQIASLIGEGTEDLIIAPSIVEGQTPALKVIAKPAVLNATTGDTYTTINAANNNAPTGSRLIVYSDQTLTSFIGGNNKTLVFDAATPGVTINRKNDKLVINSGKADAEGSPTDLTLKGFTIAGDKSTVQTAYLADVRLGGNVTLSDITVKNFCNTPNGTGNINLLRCGAGTLTLDNVKFEDCTVDAGYAYVYANTGSSCSVKGDCNFSVGLAKNVNIDATGLTGTIDLMIDSPVADTQVVTGCDDPALFTLTSMPGWMLTARDGGLILAQEPLSIPDPTITGDDCKLFAPGTDLIYVPAGSTGIARFTVPEGCTLSYRFEPSATVAAEADAPDWTDYTDAGITLTESGLLHLRLTSTDGRTGERSMYVYDDPVFTGITDTATDAATVPARYYDLRGIEVSPADMRPGIYIERRGTTVRRILRR